MPTAHNFATPVKESISLLLIRTPFQAHLGELALSSEGVTQFDLIFVYQVDSPETRSYFGKLAERAREAYLVREPSESNAIWNTHRLFQQLKKLALLPEYESVLLASVDSIVFASIALSKSKDLITFDDGIENINPLGNFNLGAQGWKKGLLRFAFCASSVKHLKEKIRVHYTIFKGYKNIVEENRLRFITGWEGKRELRDQDAACVTFFVGSPFEEDMSPAQVTSLTQIAQTLEIDFYVVHPRETKPLRLQAPVLEKDGLIAEEAILVKARGRKFRLVGGPSSVMFNLSGAETRTILFPRQLSRLEPLLQIANKSGWDVIRFN